MHSRALLIPLTAASLGIALVAGCGGSSGYGNTKYSSSPAVVVESVATVLATPTTVVEVPTATTVPPTPISTTAPAPTVAPAAAASVAVVPIANTPVPPPPAPTQAPAPPPPPPPAPIAPAPATLSLTVANFSFTPNALTVKAGQAVTVNVTNAGPSAHTFTLQSGQNTGSIAGGSSSSVQFTAPSQPGSIAFHCMIHPSMTGTITVTN